MRDIQDKSEGMRNKRYGKIIKETHRNSFKSQPKEVLGKQLIIIDQYAQNKYGRETNISKPNQLSMLDITSTDDSKFVDETKDNEMENLLAST